MPAVFAHGVPEVPAVWDPLLSRLSRTDVVALRLPGHTNSPEGLPKVLTRSSRHRSVMNWDLAMHKAWTASWYHEAEHSRLAAEMRRRPRREARERPPTGISGQRAREGTRV